MNALDLMQTAMLADLPTAADVVAGNHVVTEAEVVLILRRDGQWKAFGPYPTKEVEWHRLPPNTKIFVGTL